jgi:hypothetical protein
VDYSDEELTPPDAELVARLEAAEAALQRLRRAERESRQLRVPYRNVQYDGPVEARVERERMAAYDAAKRAQDHYNRGLEMHPANQYSQILEDSGRINAPKLTGWQWFAQNPSLLEAVPKSDADRTADARTDYILRQVKAATEKNQEGPFAWAGYEGDGAAQLRQAADQAQVYASDQRGQQAISSPYYYQPYTLTDERGEMLPLMEDPVYPRQLGESATGSPLGDRLLGLAYRPVQALWGGAGRFHDNFISGGAAASEGRGYDAAKSFAYAAPNLLSPAFHRGGPGMEDDWRSYVSPGEAAAIDTAADLPWWFFRGITRPRPGRGLVAGGVENRIRGYREELLKPLWKRAAQRHHPDVGGSTEAMQRVNAAFDAGDVETLSRMAQ